MIPDDVREYFGDIIEIDSAEQDGFPEETKRLMLKASNWLDSQPVMPEIPWANAPDDATHHAFNGYGSGIWLTDKYGAPVLKGASWTGGLWPNGKRSQSGLRLPPHRDWRDTLERRPKKVKSHN
jgi:hypothetical protein